MVFDDARHYVIWLRRQVDPGIYPNDIIVDFFHTITPWIYRALFLPFSSLGLDPNLVHLLGFMTAGAVVFSLVLYHLVYCLWPSRQGAAVVAGLAPILAGPAIVEGLPRSFALTIIALILLGYLKQRIVLPLRQWCSAWASIRVLPRLAGQPWRCCCSGAVFRS